MNAFKRIKMSVFGPLAGCLFAALSCEDSILDDLDIYTLEQPLDPYCDVFLEGIGLIDVETDYLPHVVQCENGAADFEAQKAQAVAARSYLYYKLDGGEDIEDGQRDQVYSCGRTPLPEHVEAVFETAGQVITFDNVNVCSFYVAGAVPGRSDCVADEDDPDPYNTERFVTYNWGLLGEDVIQSPLGWIDENNPYNRGCKSQNGANCLSENGWEYSDILKFYYGMDIRIERANRECASDESNWDGGGGDGDGYSATNGCQAAPWRNLSYRRRIWEVVFARALK